MGFSKGYIPWNKGKTHVFSDAHRAALSAAMKGNTNSPGPVSAEHRAALSAANRRHGHDGRPRCTPTKTTWKCMIQRCTNPKHPWYENYGGRGITVCTEWNTPRGGGKPNYGFDAFLRDMGPRPHGKVIDRIDNDLGYFKENCRWITRKEQRGNQRLKKKAA